MINKVQTIALALLLALAPLAVAKQADTISGQWIVLLEDAPLARYEGEPVQQLDAGGRQTAKKGLASTAPSVTGAAKLNVHSTAARAYRAHLAARRENLLQLAGDRLGRTVRAERVYTNVVNGFSARLSTAEAQALADVPGVRAVVPDAIHEPHLDAGPGFIGADEVWGDFVDGSRGEDVVIGIIDSGIAWGNPYFSDHLPGFVFDHPFGDGLGECAGTDVGCNDKLVGVYDFTVEGSDGEDTTGHGSNVASIAAGLPLQLTMNLSDTASIEFPTSGVAPRAQIISYKVCYNDHPSNDDLDGRCESSAILDAIDQAVADGVDVVNHSIGGDARDPWLGVGAGGNVDVAAFLDLRAAGILAVASAGNSGPGLATLSSPANAPWLMAVANISHDRRLTSNVTSFSGGDSNPGTLFGTGMTPGTGTLPIVHAADFGHPLCGEGAPELGGNCSGNTGASNPFAPGTFDGMIVVCDRGEYSRVEKGKNVMLAGAAGMVLANTQAQGESITSDEHCLPATHIGANDGDTLRDWLASGSGHQARLTGLSRQLDSDFGDRVNASSSRGPGLHAGDVMKPNVAAPGTNILGANMDTAQGDSNFGIFTGTSMAAPHVTGAAALLKSAHPDWTPAMIQSALETTATTAGMLDETGHPASAVDRGAGRIRVDRAIDAGLYLDVTVDQFADADPPNGDPRMLNLPSMFDTACTTTCSFTRTVTALADGSWQTQGVGVADITVTPGNFSLQAGQTQVLEVTVDVSNGDLIGTWVDGGVELLPDSQQIATQTLPVGVYAAGGDLPEWLEINADGNSGGTHLNLSEVVDLPRATFRTSALARPDTISVDLPDDPSADDPFDSDTGTHVTWFDVTDTSMMIYAETLASSAPDVDLYVGRDSLGLGTPTESDTRCASISPNELESCLIRNPEPGSWWVLVQNWDGSAAATDEVTLRSHLFDHSTEPSLVATGPGIHQQGPLDLDVLWDQPAMMRDEAWFGAISVGTDPDHPGNVGVIPVRITRTAQKVTEMTALAPGRTHPVVLAGADIHARLFVDVPPTATSLEVTLEGEAFSAGLSRLDFAALDGVEPATPTAPETEITSGAATGGALTLNVGGDDLQPGRYYVRVTNETGDENRINVTPTLTESGRIEGQYGLWGPANRSTSQGYSWQRGGYGFIVWYAYDEDGLPIFYLAAAPVDEDSSVWTSSLDRITSDREVAVTTKVGSVTITQTDTDRAIFTWRYNGAEGSEVMKPVTAPTCPEQGGEEVSWTGHWNVPGVGLGGTTMIVSTAAQSHLRYFFDEDGYPRWVITNGGSGIFDTDMDVLEHRGYCPYCEPTERTSEIVGIYEREFMSETEVHEVMNFTMGPPIGDTIMLDNIQTKLSERLECQ